MKIIDYVKEASKIAKTEGFGSLSRNLILLLKSLGPSYGRFYLYEHRLIDRDENDYLPRLPNIACWIIESNGEADKLEKEGFEFRSVFDKARHNLDNECIAVCIFTDMKIANISWIGMTEKAKSCFDTLPFKVNFSDGEACTGDMVTLKQYRGKGLMNYGRVKQFQAAKQRGVLITRNSVNVNNVASNKANRLFSPVIYAVASYFTCMGIKIYRESPNP